MAAPAAPIVPIAQELPAPAAIDEAQAAPPVFALPAVAGSTPALREAAPLLAAPLPTPDVRGDDFSERFSAQVGWMAGQKIGEARIQVTPHDLGPVDVRLRLDGDRISAEFLSPHGETRQALEQGLPRLRDLLGEHGFQLAHAGVGAQAEGGGNAGRDPEAMPTPQPPGGEPVAPAAMVRRTLSGLLDAYA